MRPRIYIVSPFAGDEKANLSYLALCMQDSLARGEAPFASHGFYPQYLDDTDEVERAVGMACGMTWMEVAFKCAVYEDRGLSSGMVKDIKRAASMDVFVEYRRIST